MGEAFQLRPDGLTHIPAQIAASWARAGFPVFPCGQDKRPLTPHGFKDATADLQAVAAFWQAHPKALVGLPTGPTSGLFVVDLDIDKATGEAIGEASLAALGLSQLIGAVPTVATPSGGRHLYFRDCGLGNSTSKLGPKIDTRGAGGYVIAPGSVTANGAYSLLTGPFTPEALTSVPELLTARLRGIADHNSAQPALRIDTGSSAPGWAEAALHGELGRVMAAREGERNHALNRASFSLGQIIAGGELDGASTRARLLSAALANGLSEAEAQATIASGLGAGMASPRTAPERSNVSAAQRLAPTEAEGTTAPAPATLRPFEAWKPLDPATIPRIRFVYGDAYAAGYMTVTFAAPKTGKSLLGIAEAIDATTGRGFLSGRETAPQAVLYYNAEDDQDVLNARAMAVLTANAIPQEEVAGRFFPVSGIADDRQLVLIRGEKNEINEAAFSFLAEMIARHGIALAIFDPLQDLSESPETNEAFRALGKRLRRLAHDTGVAIGIVHHTRKPSAGVQPTLDDGRGGSALRGVARFNRLLVPMTEAEGAQAGVDDFRYFFRIGEMESNLAPPSSDRNRWFQKVGVEICNGAQYPTIRPWVWPDAFGGVTVNDARKVRAAIAKRAEEGEPLRENVQAANWAGTVVAEVLGLNLAKSADKARVKAMLRKWIDTDVLAVERIKSERGKDVPHIFVGPNDLRGED